MGKVKTLLGMVSKIDFFARHGGAMFNIYMISLHFL